MKTKTFIALCLSAILCLLAGCVNNNPVPPTTEPTTEQTESVNETTTIPDETGSTESTEERNSEKETEEEATSETHSEEKTSEVVTKEETTVQTSSEEDSSSMYDGEAGLVYFGFAEDFLLRPYDWAPEDSPYETFVADTGEYSNMIGFMQTEQGQVRDFKFYKLEFVDIEEDATAYFKGEVLYTRATLSNIDPIFVQMSIEGSIPGYGFSFVNEEGFHSHALTFSGMDGSLTCMDIVLVD